ncbi:MAG: hypothetical protein Q9183_001133 [Haloplaca sp. 2 TL-2023]
MAPFRQAKTLAGHYNSHATRGRNVRRNGGQRGGLRGKNEQNNGTTKHFQTSRIEEAGNQQSGDHKVGPDDKDASSLSSEGSVNDETSSESEDSPGGSYNILLQALNPTASRGEPKQKKRKIKHDNVPASFLSTSAVELTKDSNGLPEAEEGDSSSESFSHNESEADESDDRPDFFARHFSQPDEQETSLKIQAAGEKDWLTEKATVDSAWSSTLKRLSRPDGAYSDERSSQSAAQRPRLKPKIEAAAEDLLSSSDGLLNQLVSSVFSYQDVLFCARSLNNAQAIRRLMSLHVLNHVSRTRDKVLKNNTRLSKSDDGEELEVRDQGFTRPKVLILLPTRQSCVKVVDTMTLVCNPEQQENKKRFQDSYSSAEDHLSSEKPKDFQDLFGGNDDDMFRLGLKFTRKTIKFFSQFYSSDVILASPLGLRTALESDGKGKQDHDFLSSIEIAIIDQSDALLMQNWEHVEYIFDHLNLQPREAHGCDFSRVQNWYLDGHARFFRQTIVFSAFNFPSLNKLYTQRMLNIAGKRKFSWSYDGTISKLGISVEQTFCRFEFGDATSEPDDRFDYFITGTIPALIKKSSLVSQRTLVFFPLYADFVRVRNYLATSSSTQHVSFGSISEYTPPKEVARARSHFLSGKHSILLYTERAHHFRRYHLKGVKKVVMYGLPENPLFYQEVVGGFLGSTVAFARENLRQISVRSLFSKLDLLKLERIVGTKRSVSLLSERGDTFDFV